MNLQLQQTEDGSHTLFIPDKNEHYHSTHGAIQEALTVYIHASLHFAFQTYREGQIPIVRVLEMGFGTGLNTFLTALEAQKAQIPVEYTSIEAYPLEKGIWERLNYATCLQQPAEEFQQLHLQPFDSNMHRINPFFRLRKTRGLLQETELPAKHFHAIYYDAFAPSVQPELWQTGIFQKLRQAAAIPCFFSTYCAQGQFKRNLREAGFVVSNLPGPAGKREITVGRTAQQI